MFSEKLWILTNRCRKYENLTLFLGNLSSPFLSFFRFVSVGSASVDLYFIFFDLS